MLLACALLLPCGAIAKNGSEPLNHYGFTTLQDTATGARLMGRFKAKGQPVFLIHDPNLGLRPGDIMRFQDKAVLVDPDVWQTLNDEGALARLKVAPLVRVQARATVSIWETRSDMVGGQREKKAYLLGSELLKILEETFGVIPTRQQMVMEFDAGGLVLIAPEEFLDQLKYSTVRRVPPSGRPVFISPPPARKAFAGRPFRWQAWAADPAEPTGMLRYSIAGKPPRGLAWDAATHALQGIPDSAGTWRLTARAVNATGAYDSLAFDLVVRANSPPAIANPPKPVAVAGQPWSYRAEVADADHEGSQVRVTPMRLPPGMQAETANGRIFSWTPPDSLAGTTTEMVLRLEDADGGAAVAPFTIKVIPVSDMLWSEGIKPALPWDTLKQGKTYTWEAGASAMAWSLQGITLKDVTGPDFTEFTDGSLRLRPVDAGVHEMIFVFDVQGKRVDQPVALPVSPDVAPRFASETGAWRARTGQHVSYRPAAVDDGGDPISLRAVPQGDGALAWDGVRLEMDPELPGSYAARIVASDPAGNTASQWVAYKVERAERPVAWFMENRIQAGINTWTLTADFGTGRMGLFTPNLDRIGFEDENGTTQWPYLFFGGNLLGPANERRGRRLWVDAGLTLRLPDPKVAAGGVYGRLLGEWTFPDRAIGKVEFEMQGHVNQALVIADTSNLHFIYGDDILEFSDRFSNTVDDLIQEATARENIVLFTRLEGWSRLGAGLWIGPGVSREDIPNARRYVQRLGGGLRYQARLGEAIASNTLRVAWGGGGSGWSVYWSGRLSLFSPF